MAGQSYDLHEREHVLPHQPAASQIRRGEAVVDLNWFEMHDEK